MDEGRTEYSAALLLFDTWAPPGMKDDRYEIKNLGQMDQHPEWDMPR